MTERVEKKGNIQDYLFPEVSEDFLATSVIREHDGIYFFDITPQHGQLRVDSFLHGLGSVRGVCYSSSIPSQYNFGERSAENREIYRIEQTSHTCISSPCISYTKDQIRHSFEHLDDHQYYFSLADIVRLNSTGQENPVPLRFEDIPFIASEGLFYSDYTDFYYYDPRARQIPEEYRISPEQVSRAYNCGSKNSVIGGVRDKSRALNSSKHVDGLHLSEESRDNLRTYFQRKATLQTPAEFEEGALEFLGSLELMDGDVYEYLKENYIVATVCRVHECCRSGIMTAEMRAKIEEILLSSGYFEEYKDYIAKLYELTLAKQVLEAQKRDVVRGHIAQVLRAALHYYREEGVNLFPQALSRSVSLKAGIKGLVGKFSNNDGETQALLDAIPEDKEELQFLMIRMIQDMRRHQPNSNHSEYRINSFRESDMRIAERKKRKIPFLHR